MCVSENNHDCGADEVRVMCVCEHSPFGFVPRRLSIRRRSKTILHYVFCVAATSRPALVFSLVFKTSAGTSDVVSCCDGRRVRGDEESHHEDLGESDHILEDHEDHCSASGSEDCLVMFSLFHCTMCLYSVCSWVFTVSLPPPW